jgi:hypothetical protein
MREEPPKPTIEFRNDRYLCIAVVRRLGFELPQSIRGGHRGLRSYVRFGGARDLVEWRPWALSGPRAGYPRFARARAEDAQRWTAHRGWANRGGHRQKGGRPEAALSLGRKRPRRAYTGVNPHRNNVMLRCNNCKHVSAVMFASRSGAVSHWIGGHCAAGAIRRLRSSRRGGLHCVPAIPEQPCLA